MKGWRTYAVATASVIMVALEAMTGVLGTDPETEISVLVMAGLMAALRFITTTPPAGRT